METLRVKISIPSACIVEGVEGHLCRRFAYWLRSKQTHCLSRLNHTAVIIELHQLAELIRSGSLAFALFVEYEYTSILVEKRGVSGGYVRWRVPTWRPWFSRPHRSRFSVFNVWDRKGWLKYLIVWILAFDIAIGVGFNVLRARLSEREESR